MALEPIGLCGKPLSGKNVFASVLEKEFGYEVYEISTPLKRVAYTLFDVPFAVWTEDKKEAYLNIYLDDFVGINRIGLEVNDEGQITYRSLLQILGSGVLVKHAPTVLIGLLSQAIRGSQLSVAVPGVRSDSEAQVIKGFGGTIVEIVRPSVKDAHTHKIERGISRSLIDHTIIAEDIEDLKAEARDYARRIRADS